MDSSEEEWDCFGADILAWKSRRRERRRQAAAAEAAAAAQHTRKKRRKEGVQGFKRLPLFDNQSAQGLCGTVER